MAGAGCGSSAIAPETLEPGAAGRRPAAAQGRGRHYNAARAAFLEGDLDRANLKAMLALKDDPLDSKSHFLLGCVLVRKGEVDRAIVGFQRALEIDPVDPETIYNLGTLLLWREEPFPACRLLESAVSVRPDHIPSYNNLARAYFQVGLPELAIATYEEALRRDPSNAIALANLLCLTEAAGLRVPAETYRRRLQALGLDPVARTSLNAAAPLAPAPSRPVTAAPVTAGKAPAAAPPLVLPDAGEAPEDPEVNVFRELLHDLPHVTVERRAGRLTLTGWTSGRREREMLDRILGRPAAAAAAPERTAPGTEGKPPEILDLTSTDVGDADRMIEIDAVIFIVRGLDSSNLGFDFLRAVNLNFNYFASGNKRAGTGYSAPPDVTGAVNGLSQQGWIFAASVDYLVNIANATDQRVAVLARPHLTALSGTPAKFLAGGELVFKVSGLNSGDIKPYPFGTTVTVTPTLRRTPAEGGTPRVHLGIEAGRTSVLSLLEQDLDPEAPVAFDKVTVTSEAVLEIGQTLILSGLSQRESRTGNSGVPILSSIPIIRYFFSTRTNIQSDAAVVILLTPRDAAFLDDRNRESLREFIDMRRALIEARKGTPEDMERFRERYPDAMRVAPNRFASHFFLMENSELYRAVSGQDLSSEDLELNLLGPGPIRLHSP